MVLTVLLENLSSYIAFVEARELEFKVESSDFEHIEIFLDFGEYLIDKQGRWRDPKTGKFISMPDIKNPDIKKHIASEIAAGRGGEAQRLLNDIDKLRLLNLSTPGAYNATVDKLRRKYKNSPFSLSLISAMQLDRGVSNKGNTTDKIRELKNLLKVDNTTPTPALKYKLKDINLSEIKIFSDDELGKLNSKTLTDKDNAALDAALKYHKSVENLNAILTEVNSRDNVDDDDYNRLYTARENTWKTLKEALDASHSLKNDYLSESTLDEYMEAMRSVSRESPGGYKIALPSSIEQVKEKAKVALC